MCERKKPHVMFTHTETMYKKLIIILIIIFWLVTCKPPFVYSSLSQRQTDLCLTIKAYSKHEDADKHQSGAE